jgi:hypothetical protein
MQTDDDTLAAVAARRRAGAGARALVQVERPGDTWQPASLRAKLPGLEVHEWVCANLNLVRDLLAERGAVRLCGMSVTTQTFGATVAEVAGAPLADYVNRSTPRMRVQGKVFTSTEYSRYHSIPMHSEQSYARAWPLMLGLWCVRAATSGGETPLAPTVQVLDAIPPALVERFEAHGVMYDRWYQPNLDLPWQDVFQTSSPDAVDRICVDAGISAEWHDHDVLHTRHVAQATTLCPASGRRGWFNQAHLFHVEALPVQVAAALRRTAGARLPRNACFGDGRPISAADIHAVESAFEAATWQEPWCSGDVMLVDNVAVAHGRRPFSGDREVLVAMAGTGGDTGAGSTP